MNLDSNKEWEKQFGSKTVAKDFKNAKYVKAITETRSRLTAGTLTIFNPNHGTVPTRKIISRLPI